MPSWAFKEHPVFSVFISQHTGCTEVNETRQDHNKTDVRVEYEVYVFIVT